MAWFSRNKDKAEHSDKAERSVIVVEDDTEIRLTTGIE